MNSANRGGKGEVKRKEDMKGKNNTDHCFRDVMSSPGEVAKKRGKSMNFSTWRNEQGEHGQSVRAFGPVTSLSLIG